jgi:hypothetical protein
LFGVIVEEILRPLSVFFGDWPNKNAFVSKDVNILQKIELFNLGDIIKAFARRCLWQSRDIVLVCTPVVNDSWYKSNNDYWE